MRKILTIAVMLFTTVVLFGQARKPIIMVMPSDAYCFRSNYTTSYIDESGKKIDIPDYNAAVSRDENLRLVISELSKMMAKRGFPLKDMEQTLKSIKNEEVRISHIQSSSGSQIIESPVDQLKRVASADIIMDLDFSIKAQGPKKYITFNLRGVDAYSNKVITTASGAGQPSSNAPVELLLEEAVLNYMDSFNGMLQDHFNDMFKNGREVTITLRMFDSSPYTFEDEFEFMGETVSFGDIMDWWMDENCVNRRFSRTMGSDYVIKYEQVRMPLFKVVLGKERAIDTRGFVSDLVKFLNKDPFNTTAKIEEIGLGEVYITIGDK